jgi:serine/threonine-protein kinase
MITEALGGQTLHARLKSGALDVHTAATYLRQVALGLDYASSQGRHHLGLSPKNVWLTSGNKAVVAGLNMAALAAETAPSADFLASAFESSGYLSPEQILGGIQDESTDVYALGLILSEALCARPTWDKSLRADALAARAITVPVLPGSVIPSIPAEIDVLIGSCVEPQATARTASLASFALTLDRFINPTFPLPETAAFTPVPQAVPQTETPADPAINPDLAKLFPATSLSSREFTLSEFTAGRKPRGFVALLSTMVGIVVALAVGILVVVSLMPANFVPETTRAVPGVVGDTYEDAAATIERAGLVPVRSDTNSSTVASGTVISLTPSVGTKLEIGAKVTVSVSSGSESGTVPNLVGMHFGAAQTYLTKAGFVLGTVTDVDRGSVAKGSIVATVPAAGEAAATGSKVNLTRASGNVKIPDLLGKTITEATAILAGPDIGMTPSLVANSACPASSPVTVRTQSAGPGTIASTTKISLTYCTGN